MGKHCILLMFVTSMALTMTAQTSSPLSLVFEPVVNRSNVVWRGDLQLAVPILRSEKNQFIVSPQFRLISVDHQLPFTNTEYSQSSIRLMGRHLLNSKSNINWILGSTFASSLWDYSSESLTGLTMVRYNRSVSGYLSYSVGAMYSQRFSGNLIAPMAGVNWKMRSTTHLSIILPLVMRITQTSGNNFKWGVYSSGNSYYTYLPNDSQYKYFWLRERYVGLFFQSRIVKHWWITSDLNYIYHGQLNSYQTMDRHQWQIGSPYSGNNRQADYETQSHGFSIRLSIAFQSFDNYR